MIKEIGGTLFCLFIYFWSIYGRYFIYLFYFLFFGHLWSLFHLSIYLFLVIYGDKNIIIPVVIILIVIIIWILTYDDYHYSCCQW